MVSSIFAALFAGRAEEVQALFRSSECTPTRAFSIHAFRCPCFLCFTRLPRLHSYAVAGLRCRRNACWQRDACGAGVMPVSGSQLLSWASQALPLVSHADVWTGACCTAPKPGVNGFPLAALPRTPLYRSQGAACHAAQGGLG